MRMAKGTHVPMLDQVPSHAHATKARAVPAHHAHASARKSADLSGMSALNGNVGGATPIPRPPPGGPGTYGAMSTAGMVAKPKMPRGMKQPL